MIDYHRLPSWPRLPIFLSQATGYWPTRETVVAQVVAPPRVRHRRLLHVRDPAPPPPAAAHGDAAVRRHRRLTRSAAVHPGCGSASTSAGPSPRRSPSTWPRARSSAGPWSRPPTPTPRGVAAGVVRDGGRGRRGRSAPTGSTWSPTRPRRPSTPCWRATSGRSACIGLGRRPELKQARKRTQLDRIELSPGPLSCARSPSSSTSPTGWTRAPCGRRSSRLPGRRGDRGQRGRGLRARRLDATSDGSPRWRPRPACRPARPAS